jgi:hypothetical protein
MHLTSGGGSTNFSIEIFLFLPKSNSGAGDAMCLMDIVISMALYRPEYMNSHLVQG